MQRQQQQFQNGLSQAAYFILASLVQGPKHAVELRETVEQREGALIEPGTLYRVLAHLERRGWIEGLDEQGPLRRYRLTTLGMLTLEQTEVGGHREKPWEGRSSGLRKGKEIIMRLMLWILHLYPPAWRERYETEMAALLEQHHITPWTVLDLLVGALDARLDPHYHRARQLLPLRRFQASWRLVVGAMVVFWVALLPWFWMSVLGIGSDTRCSDWGNDYAHCMLRVTVGMHATSLGQQLVGTLLGALPLLLMAFMAVLILGRGRKARTRLLLVLPLTIGMFALCLACAGWLGTLWPLLPQISQFYPQATAGLLAGLVGMGLATVLALGSLARAAFALRALSATAPKQKEPGQALPLPYTDQLAAAVHGRGDLSGRPGSVPKGWVVVLVVLLLLFSLSWTLPVISGGPNPGALLFLLVTWLLTGIVGLITAWLVKSPGKQAERATRKPRRVTSPLVWAAILPLAFFLFTFQLRGDGTPFDFSVPVPLWVKLGYLLLYFLFGAFVSGMTALLLTIRRRWPHLERTLRYVGIGVGGVLFILMILMRGSLFPWAGPGAGPGGWLVWLVVSCLSIIPALFVRVPGSKQQVESATGPLSVDAAPKVWALYLLILLAVSMVTQMIPPGGTLLMLVYIIALCVNPALVVKIRHSNQQAGYATGPAPNSMSPKIWIIVAPVLFLVFIIDILSIGITDYPDFGDVLTAWLLTGLASLIILLALKLGSRKSMDSAPREALQQVQVQG